MAARSSGPARPWLRKKWPWLALAVVAAAGVVGLKAGSSKPEQPAPLVAPRRVTALGRLTPKGGLVTLSVPSGTSGGNEVVQEWFAGEGEPIREGQVLARLSSFSQLQSSLDEARANLEALESLLPFLEISEEKSLSLIREGAISEEQLGQATATLISRKADIQASRAAVTRAEQQLEAGEIRSPLNGTLIRIYSWPGMKETTDGLALVGRTGQMEVWAQVFQSDIEKLKIGQRASVTAESGGFPGFLRAELKSIVANVSDRDLFATNSNNDVNARVVLVKLGIDPDDRKKVERLSGLNVTVVFDQ